MLPFWRLDPPFRFAVYIAFAVLFASGAAWLAADRMKESSEEEIWQESAAWLIMLHGGTAMLTLMLLGALVPVHIGRAWRARKNRATGIVMAACNAVLIVTAFGLYYLASETLRPWASDIHIAFGLSLPVLLLVHVKTGRKPSAPRVPRRQPGSQAPPRS
jgi:cyanate permease